VSLPPQRGACRRLAAGPDDLIYGRVHPALSVTRAGAGHEGRPVLWAVWADQTGGVGHLPRARRARTDRRSRGLGLADGVPGPWSGSSRMLSSVWSSAGPARCDPTLQDSTPRERAVGRGGMNRGPPVGAWRPRAGSALTPGQAGFRSTQARYTVRESIRFWRRHRLASAIGLLRRGCAGINAAFKFHSQGMRDSVRG
jgi:hypothetical protein